MSLTIGSLAKAVGVGVETVRFYEREKLIPKPPRTRSGYRQYPEDTVDRVRFIRLAKELGFTLAEIRELLALRVNPRGNCQAVKRRAEAKVVEMEDKINQLERIKSVLGKLVHACDERIDTGSCPILESLT